MPRTYSPPAQIDIRKALARDALASYERWLATGEDRPVAMGKLAASLELLLEAVSGAGL